MQAAYGFHPPSSPVNPRAADVSLELGPEPTPGSHRCSPLTAVAVWDTEDAASRLVPGPSADGPHLPAFVTAVSVYTNGTVFASNTDIVFVAVTEETSPLEFSWYFGQEPVVRTTSRSISRRLRDPRGCVHGAVGRRCARSKRTKRHIHTQCHQALL